MLKVAPHGIKQSREVVFLTALLAAECFLIFGCSVALWWAYGELLNTTEAGSGPIKLRPAQLNRSPCWVRKKPVESSVPPWSWQTDLSLVIGQTKKKKAQAVVNYCFFFLLLWIIFLFFKEGKGSRYSAKWSCQSGSLWRRKKEAMESYFLIFPRCKYHTLVK